MFPFIWDNIVSFSFFWRHTFDERVMFVDLLVDGLILHLVKVYALQKIIDGRFAVHILVVGRVYFDLFDIGLDDTRVVAQWLHEKQAETEVFRAVVAYQLATFMGSVRCIEYLSNNNKKLYKNVQQQKKSSEEISLQRLRLRCLASCTCLLGLVLHRRFFVF